MAVALIVIEVLIFVDGNALEQHLEVVERVHRHADLADLRQRQRVVRAVAALGRQVEGDRQAGLAA